MPNAMKPLYDQLKPMGYSLKFLKDFVLPDWWDDEVAATSAGLQQARMILSRSLGLDFLELTQGRVRAGSGAVAYRCTQRTDTENLPTVAAFALQVASHVTYAHKQKGDEAADPNRIPQATKIRDWLLKQNTQFLTFSDMVEICWAYGIPVIQIHHSPFKKKPDGIALQTEHGPAIVLFKTNSQAPWLLFPLAHEFGHIARKHLAANAIILDMGLNANPTKAREVTDEQEEEADSYAFQMLTGVSSPDFSPIWAKVPRRPSGTDLAPVCSREGKVYRIDPGFLALCYGYEHQNWAAANAALKIIGRNRENPQSFIYEQLLENVDLDSLADDTAAFIQRVLTPP